MKVDGLMAMPNVVREKNQGKEAPGGGKVDACDRGTLL